MIKQTKGRRKISWEAGYCTKRVAHKRPAQKQQRKYTIHRNRTETRRAVQGQSRESEDKRVARKLNTTRKSNEKRYGRGRRSLVGNKNENVSKTASDAQWERCVGHVMETNKKSSKWCSTGEACRPRGGRKTIKMPQKRQQSAGSSRQPTSATKHDRQ